MALCASDLCVSMFSSVFIVVCVSPFQDFLLKEEHRALEYNLTTTELELDNVSASWDEVCLCNNFTHRYGNHIVGYPANPEFSREPNLNLLSESLWERAKYSLPDSPGPEH